MKVYIGPLCDRWVSYVHDKYMNKKYGWDWPETQTRFENFLEKLEDVLQWIYNHTINLILDKRSGQKISVHIDNYDTWSMDHTLAPIILPMLKQLRGSKHGSPMVDMTDVSQELRVNDVEAKEFWDNGHSDPKQHDRWDWVMGEMIWAFEQKCRDDWMEDYHHNKWDKDGANAHQKRMSNGFRLFGKYYESLWD